MQLIDGECGSDREWGNERLEGDGETSDAMCRLRLEKKTENKLHLGRFGQTENWTIPYGSLCTTVLTELASPIFFRVFIILFNFR